MAKRILIVLCLTSVAGILTAADNPFIGTWKLNPAKSKFTGESMSFEKTADGMRFSAAGESYALKMDGADTAALFGYTAAWKQVSDHGWETANKLNGKLLSTDYLTLSGDGKTLTIVSKGTKPDGTPFADTTVHQRESGKEGLAGKWRNKGVKISSPNTIQCGALDGEGLTCKSPDYGSSWGGRFDEKDFAVTGPTVPPGATGTMKRLGPRSIEMTEKINGKAIFRMTWTVSADGKTMTSTGSPVAVNEPTTAVFDRQ